MRVLKVYLVYYLRNTRRYDYISGAVGALGKELSVNDSEPYYFAAFTREIDAINYCKNENKTLNP